MDRRRHLMERGASGMRIVVTALSPVKVGRVWEDRASRETCGGT